jgi:hypothetical protein
MWRVACAHLHTDHMVLRTSLAQAWALLWKAQL